MFNTILSNIKVGIFLLATGLLSTTAVLAAPAPWYQWKSKLNGEFWCTQNMPGDGWIRISGPFKDAQCRTLGRPGK